MVKGHSGGDFPGRTAWWEELVQGNMCFSSSIQRKEEKAGVGCSLWPASWDQLTSPVPLPGRTGIVSPILTFTDS